MANDLFAKSESQIEDIIYRQIKYKEKVLIEQKMGRRIFLMNGFSDVKSSNDAGVETKEVENPNSDFGDGDGVNEFDDTYKRMSKNNEIMEYSEKTSDINTDKDDGKKKI